MRTATIVLTPLSLLVLFACTTTPPSNDAQPEQLTITWLLEKETTDENGMTTADISLVVLKEDGSARGIDLGRFAGCGERAAPEDGPLLTLQCWWAGGGDEFQVRMDATNTLIVDHRVLDEMVDIPEFTSVRSILLPDNAMIVPKANVVL